MIGGADEASVVPGADRARVEEAIVPALELAVVVARVSGRLRPPAEVPKGLRAMVRFAKLPPSARAAVRRTLDSDEAFRERVALAAVDMELPHPSWLFLHRPPGWEAELAELVVGEADAEATVEAERTARALQRRLAGAEAAVGRLEGAVLASRAEVARLSEELAGERRVRRQAEAGLEVAQRRVAALDQERVQALARLERTTAEVDGLRRAMSSTEAGLAATAQERSELRGELAAARAALHAVRSEVAEVSTGASMQQAARVDVVARALGDAAAAATALGAALAAAATGLVTPDGDAGDSRGGDLGGGEGRSREPPLAGPRMREDGPGRATPSRAARASLARERKGRLPQTLPLAVHDDSPEAAEHLVRLPRMLVLVDGYNVTLSTWEELPIADQRVRLIDACSELVARCGPEVLVIFDGAHDGGGLPPVRRGGVRWRFTPAGIEADDVLLDQVAALDPDRPVTVASSDKRVRDGARRLGANAISTPQLLAVLRRVRPKGAGRS